MKVRGAMDLLPAPFLADVSINLQDFVRFAPILSDIEEHCRENLFGFSYFTQAV